MKSPNLDNAPQWAQYVAMDYSGQWYYFEKEPHQRGSKWQTSGRMQFAGNSNEGKRQWRKTLRLITKG